MDLDKTYKTDREEEETGRWFPLTKDSRVRLARINNARYNQRLDELMRAALAKQGEEATAGLPSGVAARAREILPQEIQDRILCDTLAETILLDWEGFEEKGQPLAYSTDAATRLLLEYPDFRGDIVYIASQMASFLAREVEDTVKN